MYSPENQTAMDHVNKKWVKVITVITYIISVSLVALILGLYYKLAWHPKYEVDKYNLNNDDSSIVEFQLGNFIVREHLDQPVIQNFFTIMIYKLII